MSNSVQDMVTVYAEATPNPDSLKFVVNKPLMKDVSIEFKSQTEAEKSPIAKALFEKPYVTNVMLMDNFIAITKKSEEEWVNIIPELRDFIKNYVTEGKELVSDELVDTIEAKRRERLESQGENEGIVRKIHEVLEEHVKPAVQTDGGHIEFKSFEDGVVTLILRGSCSGCPSAIVTLKAGIEGLLKRILPEVKEVRAEEL